MDIAKPVTCLGFDQVLGALWGGAVVSDRDRVFEYGAEDADRQGPSGEWIYVRFDIGWLGKCQEVGERIGGSSRHIHGGCAFVRWA